MDEMEKLYDKSIMIEKLKSKKKYQLYDHIDLAKKVGINNWKEENKKTGRKI